MSAKELLNLPPAEWSEVIDSMSWRELREVAEKMHKAALRVRQLSGVLSNKVEERGSVRAELQRLAIERERGA